MSFKKQTWDGVTNECITSLHPLIRSKATFFVNFLEDQNIFVRIYCGYRSSKEQSELYEQGRTTPGKIVTYAKAFESYHNYRLAFDCVPVVDGVAEWNSIKWEEVAQIGELFGFEWGGRFSNPDKPHFQYTFGLNYKTLFNLHKEQKYKDGYLILDNYL